MGLDQSLALTGDLALAPQMIETATQGRITPTGPIPVSLRVGGTLKAPTIEVVGIERTVAALAGALLKGRAKGLLDKLPGGGGGPLGRAVGGAVGAAVADPAEAQRKLQEEAQRKLQEEAQRRRGGGQAAPGGGGQEAPGRGPQGAVRGGN